MKLEMGKEYKTRNGRKAVVVADLTHLGLSEPFVVRLDDEDEVLTYNWDGVFFSTGEDSILDIVSEVK